MNLIRKEWSELSAFVLKNLLYLTVYTVASSNIDHSAPNFGEIYMTNRLWMSLIMGPIGLEWLQFLFALELEKIAAFDFVHTLASTNINQTAPNLVKMYMTIRFQTSSIMDQIRSDHSL